VTERVGSGWLESKELVEFLERSLDLSCRLMQNLMQSQDQLLMVDVDRSRC